MSDEQRRSHEEEGDNNAWMSTFSDLLMLMLTFFVLLLTMSSMDKQKIDKVVRPGLQMQQGPSQSPTIMDTPAIPRVMPRTMVEIHQQLALAPLNEVATQFADVSEEILSAYEMEGRGWISRRPDGVDIHLDGAIVFEPGEDKLTPRSKKMLEEFVGVATAPGVRLLVETHVSGGDDEDFWSRQRGRELALRRADVIARFFTGKGFDKNGVRVMGHGLAAGSREGRFLRQDELLSLKIELPKRR
jgi:chemotaxis protein MotB